MKIQAFDTTTKNPLVNTKFQIQVRGKDSGYLTITTDGNGYFTLDDKYKNHQIAFTTGSGTPGQWVNANDGVKLFVSGIKQTTATTTEK